MGLPVCEIGAGPPALGGGGIGAPDGEEGSARAAGDRPCPGADGPRRAGASSDPGRAAGRGAGDGEGAEGGAAGAGGRADCVPLERIGRRGAGGAGGSTRAAGACGVATSGSTSGSRAAAAGASTTGSGWGSGSGAGAGTSSTGVGAGDGSGAGASAAAGGDSSVGASAASAAFFLAGAFLAGVFLGSSGCCSRRMPSWSALRRTRSACASCTLEEWLFTPMPSCSQRSRSSLFESPSSFASSCTRGFLGKEVPNACRSRRPLPDWAAISILAQRGPAARSPFGAARAPPRRRQPSALWQTPAGGRRHRSSRANPGTARHPDPAVYDRAARLPPARA